MFYNSSEHIIDYYDIRYVGKEMAFLVCDIFFQGIVGYIHKYVVCIISGICILRK